MISTAVEPILSLFCRHGFKERSQPFPGRGNRRVILLFAISTQGRLLCTQRSRLEGRVAPQCIINFDSSIGHETKLENFVTLYPSVNLSGNVNVGHNTEIGTGANIIQGLKIGSDSIIGAGSVVIRDVPSKCTSVGVPSKPIKHFD